MRRTPPIYGVFSASDGHVVIAAQVDDSWARLARLIGGDALDTRFATPQGRAAHYVEATAIVKAWASALSSADCLAALDGPASGRGALPCRRSIRSWPIRRSPARGMIVEQEHPTLGTVRLPNLPFRFSDCDTSPRFPAPLLGQHNAEIARELGFAEAEIAAMQADGVLHAESAAHSARHAAP